MKNSFMFFTFTRFALQHIYKCLHSHLLWFSLTPIMILFTVGRITLHFYDIDWANYKSLNTFMKLLRSKYTHDKLNLFYYFWEVSRKSFVLLKIYKAELIHSILILIQLSLFLCTFDILRYIFESNFCSIFRFRI